MKTKYLLILLAVALIAGVFFVQDSDEREQLSGLVREGEGPVQLKDKHLWEFERLRDPKTGKIPAGIERASAEFSAKLPVAARYDNKGNKTLAGSWQKRGPHFVGGRTRALAIDKLDNKILLAGGVSGGMWKSTDDGTSWVKKTTSTQLQSVSCVAQDTRPGKENIWYYGTGEYFNIYGGLRGDGIMKSTDGGETWFGLESTLSKTPQSWDSRFDYIWNIAVNHKNLEQDELFAATAVGCIVRSTDGGETWTTVLGSYGNESSWFTDIEITANGVFYATLSQKTFDDYANSKNMGIYRSLDGVEWTEITPDFIPKQYRRVCIGVAPSDENQVYFLAETPESGKLTRNSRGDSLWHSIWKYTYLSDDGSGEWDDRSSSIPRVDPTRLHFNSQGSYDLIVKVHPENADIVYIGGTSLYRSTDGF
ncbi:MAG: hypothetical protein PF588_07395 [Candidatus Kapabacteria bacterium]|jgi:hypothetical protein|nr:hypothetical protein [Candidatus Kapabacteria bacterium]